MSKRLLHHVPNIKIICEIAYIFLTILSIWNFMCILHWLHISALATCHGLTATCGLWRPCWVSTVLVLWVEVCDFCFKFFRTLRSTPWAHFRCLENIWVDSNVNSSWRVSFDVFYLFNCCLFEGSLFGEGIESVLRKGKQSRAGFIWVEWGLGEPQGHRALTRATWGPGGSARGQPPLRRFPGAAWKTSSARRFVWNVMWSFESPKRTTARTCSSAKIFFSKNGLNQFHTMTTGFPWELPGLPHNSPIVEFVQKELSPRQCPQIQDHGFPGKG